MNLNESRRKKTKLSTISIEPQLALLADKVPTGKQWIYEIKLDGYRTLTRINGRKIEMLTRKGLDWTKKYSALARELKKLKVDSAIFDGEVVVLNNHNQSHFFDLQIALKNNEGDRLKYYLFDLLYLNGLDLRSFPLEKRKEMLRKILNKSHLKSKKICFSEHFYTSGKELFYLARQQGLEGGSDHGPMAEMDAVEVAHRHHRPLGDGGRGRVVADYDEI